MKKTISFIIFALFGSFFFLNGQTINYDLRSIQSEKTDVWDFGAVQLDETLYNNNLTAEIINSWYTGVTPGTAGKTLPTGFTAGVLSWTGGSNDRLRTSNTALTRYDENVTSTNIFNGETFTGRLYVNAGAAVGRYMGLTLSEDDEVAIYGKSDAAGKLTFEYMGDNTQKDVKDINTTFGLFNFVAKKAGTYHIYDSVNKPSYYRIVRKNATYVNLSGSINTENASGLPNEYSLIFTNEAGKQVSVALTPSSSTYSLKVPAGYTYTLSLNANGFIITNGTSVTVDAETIHDVVIEKVATNTLSGAITGLNSTQLNALQLVFTPETEGKKFIPIPVINTEESTYSVDIEPNCKYTISANGLNDFYITNNEVNITENTVREILFNLKPTYKVDLVVNGLNSGQLSNLEVTFTNLKEAGYKYAFSDLNNINLRDAVYSITCGGLNAYPIELGATSNLTVNGAATSKELVFKPVTNWSFDDMVITNGVTLAYKGMQFTGTAYNEIAKGHLVIKDNATVAVPVSPGEKIVITYYYSANFTVDGSDPVTTASGSTSIFEKVEFAYSNSTPGNMIISNVSGTTYITDITVAKAVAYSSVITVGSDKDYQTINEALAAVRSMNRPNSERVKIMVDPGNYEEMLMIDIDNVSIINAAVAPSIALENKGVDIDGNAVRITSYYGHGYNYYSMGTNQKWSADALRVNKENGYTTYTNTGSGTTNGSYWNATVVVTAKGFEASYIIFENSFNQYISKKESEDVVVEWASGGKGVRPTTKGNTGVQGKSFVERAAAIAYTAGGDKSILTQCRIVGRQDSFYGAEGARIVAYKGSLMGGTDYLFGGMTLVAYESDLAMNTSETSTDVAYITAAQQNSARGYLFYNCTVTSAQPGTETASEYLSKPGYFGRPWQATTSEVVFYNTTIKATDNPSNAGKSMIVPAAWLSSLGGESDKCYEYGTIEESGEDNSSARASWSHVLNSPTLKDGTEITPYNFTKGSDGWDPLPSLTSIKQVFNGGQNSELSLIQQGNTVKVSGVKSVTNIAVYRINGGLNERFTVTADTEFPLQQGLWIVRAFNQQGHTSVKVLIP